MASRWLFINVDIGWFDNFGHKAYPHKSYVWSSTYCFDFLKI